MPKASGLPPLNLSAPKNNEERLSPASLSPRTTGSPRSPRSAPSSPRLQTAPASLMQHVNSTQGLNINGAHQSAQQTSTITAMPDLPPSPDRASPRQHSRDPSKSFFSNLMASKSSHKLHVSSDVTEQEKQNARSRASSKDRSLHSIRRQGSTPELPRYNMSNNTSAYTTQEASNTRNITESPDMGPPRQKAKSKFGGILTRTRTLRLDDNTKLRGQPPSSLRLQSSNGINNDVEPPPRTAPVKSDHRARAFGQDSNGSTPRNRSADRYLRDDALPQRRPVPQGNLPVSQSHGGLHLLSNVQSTGKGFGDRFGKASKGLFTKITRSGSANEREVVNDDNYVCNMISLPLIKQTRKTRIARQLERSRDKTEFWMPALPWRCIDYLNMNGCEEEGLYRIPGSGKEVKHWQRRFDIEHDINLFDEPDLHDINTIGSMFKAWLRDLPDEILPKEIQNKVAQQCAGVTRTPQLLKDELSKLPPFNYYLLFAITCHLSLLTSFADKNKMDYRNLCICFQPCLKIDAFCFQFLVMDWKNCWQGCWTEKEYLEEEHRYEREGSIDESEDLAVDDRALSSSDSSQHQAQQMPALRTADAAQRKSSAPQPKKQRSLSQSETRKSSQNSSHQTARSVPLVPRLVETPEPQKIPSPDALPEVAGLSPIRF